MKLDPNEQLISEQCSGPLLISELGLLSDVPACTDLTIKPWVIYKLAVKQQAEAAIHYLSPVSEKEQYVNHCINVVEQYI